jgi:hypothetical protein
VAKNREEILALAKRRFVEVDGIRLQNLTEYEQSKLEARWASRYEETKELDLTMRRELLAVCIVDDEGTRIFKSNEVDALKDIDAAVTKKLYEACRVHCGMDEAKVVAKLEKKSEEITD